MMALETYRSKRDFTVTPEPAGDEGHSGGDAYVIQKHAARRLHYDLRLELGGALKSWAVTKGPSLVPGEKRLAVEVEDHPLEYGGFESTIPKGEYGGGAVIVWDRGTWAPIGDAGKGFARGHLEFTLSGDKLRGSWHLVRMRGKPRDKRANWLLIKGEDAEARDEAARDILEERPESVLSGRTIEDVAGGATPKPRKTARPPARGDGKKAALPDFVAPALATLRAAPPAGDEWLHEVKFDGYRLQARLDGGALQLLTRGGLDWTGRFGPRIAGALRALPVKTALLDGEVVVESGHGASDFPALQADLSTGRDDRFLFYLFDLLYLDGRDLRKEPLLRRKALLEDLLRDDAPALRYSAHFAESGALVLRHACRLSLEGIVSKLADAPYRSGRGRAWVKSKCSARQEFVIGGYAPSTVSDHAIGSLVLGVYESDELQHVGRVGTGFAAAMAEDLFTRLEKLRQKSSPFMAPLTATEARHIRYVRPELVAEVEFRAWTADGHLRHASFRGLREDKPASDIVREAPAGRAPAEPRRRVALTHPDRIYWPGAGITKEGLADYHAGIWTRIAPWITGRPLALLRCPTGITGQKFFQKHAWKGMSRAITRIHDPADPQGEPLITVEDLDGLMGLVQAAALEIHPWGATTADWDHPDMITMDLDPGEGVEWDAVIRAALELRERLAEQGLAGFVKTSGGKGLHVVAPLRPRADWAAVKVFTKALADAMAADSPARYVSTISKAKRRGRILIDYLRNQRGQTAVAAFSPRARPGAAVSTPLGWEELDEGIGPTRFTIANVPARLAALRADPWEGFREAAAPIKAARKGRRG
ncbi:DNA ligase D [Pontibaca methylaminivorans]|uniref:DNA ligase D n=1 Tax=Pontibaca methylaminivorans TaxID=515897 RepID=UPI002FDA4AB1